MPDATNQTATTEGTGTQATTEGASTQTTNQTAQGLTTEGNTSLLNEGEATKTETKTEGKTESDKKTDVKVGAPEKYEPFKAPEGYQYDEKGLTEATTLFKDIGLNQDQAQKLMDVYAKKIIEAQTSAKNAGEKAIADMRKTWRDQTKADADIGNKLGDVKQTITKALDSLGIPEVVKEFRKAMDDYAIGDHPAFIKVFHKLAEGHVEGSHVGGKGPSAHGQNANGAAVKPSAAQAIYGPTGPRSDLGSRAS